MSDAPSSPHLTEAAARRLKARRRADARLRAYGLIAIAIAALALAGLLSSVFGKAAGALTAHSFRIEATLPADKLGATPEAMAAADYNALAKQALYAQFPELATKKQKKALADLISSGAADDLRAAALAGDVKAGAPARLNLLASADADLYYKGAYGALTALTAQGTASLKKDGDAWRLTSSARDFAPVLAEIQAELKAEALRLRDQAAAQQRGVDHYAALAASDPAAAEAHQAEAQAFSAKRDELAAQAEALEKRAAAPGAEEPVSDQIPGLLAKIGGGWARVAAVSQDGLRLEPLTTLAEGEAAPGAWGLLKTGRPAAGRKISDQQIALLETLRERGAVESAFNTRFFTSGDSREAELAGVKSAVVGAFWTLLVTFVFAFPMGVAAAVWLEEFAPKNRITDFIEVNINNLAAVPSIVYGLLGLGVFLNFMGLPRGAPLAGGLVLGLMTLPTIIIAARAAIRAVPPSIRDAALGLGASKMQTVFHHVLPLATPGLMTGAILGLARALGETAPLLMIGMAAFIVNPPRGPLDPSTSLPAQIFRWSDLPERAFEFRTAAAIVTLLVLLICMNALAVIIRRRFERRW